jgi:apurinic endonuclease APN1
MVFLEGSAGATLGGSFAELRAILDAVDGHPRVGICLDTAHLFAAGWDIRTAGGVTRMLDAFDEAIGLDRLRIVHLNDSSATCGSRLDRHENIGQGAIGLKGFRAIVRERRLRGLPGIIETPGFDRAGPDRRNLEILRVLRGRSG